MQPREKLKQFGSESLKNHELLALILCNGTRDQNVVELSKSILLNWNLNDLVKSDVDTLTKINGIGIARACQINAIGRILELQKEKKRNVKKINSTKKVIELIKREYSNYYTNLEHGNINSENLILIYLNKNMEFIDSSFLTSHMKNKIFMSNSYLIKECIYHRAHYVIIVHNHIKDELHFSKTDKSSYKKLLSLLKKIEIKLIDYIIFNRNGYLSIKSK